MRTEIHFGSFTHWISNAASYFDAAIQTLQECINQYKTFPQRPFHIINMDTGDEEFVGLADVINIMALSAEYDPSLPEPPIDSNCDIMRFARLKSLDCRKRELSLSK